MVGIAASRPRPSLALVVHFRQVLTALTAEDPMASNATHCTFCDLIHGAGEVSVCYEDADAVAFMDIQPVNPGHVLVVPREHFE